MNFFHFLPKKIQGKLKNEFQAYNITTSFSELQIMAIAKIYILD